jgi:cation-transporting ATPase 13A1
LFKEHAVAPFFVFQVFCVGLWCLDEYWYYSMFTLFMLIGFESTVVMQRLRTLKEFRTFSLTPFKIYVYRHQRWIQINSDELLPGDVCSIVRSEGEMAIPCDMVLLDGHCIVNEAMLSGESTPQGKESILLREPEDTLDPMGVDKLHILFGGTKVLQVTAPTSEQWKTPDGGCVAFVLRTGFGTCQGKLVRTMVFNTEHVSANNVEAFLFIGFLLIFAIIAAAYVWVVGKSSCH